MSENREEILADFQACTGIEDIGEAFTHLDEAKWDLLAAINRVMPQDTQTLPSEIAPDIEMLEEIRRPSAIINGQAAVSLSPDFIEIPSTSHGNSIRRLTFHVNYNDRVIEFNLPETSTLGDLKTVVYSKLGVPVCRQVLTGWLKNPSSDYITLSALNLPRENMLFLTYLDSDNNTMDVDRTEELLTKTYTLNVTDENKRKDYSLKYPGSKTVEEVKADVYNLTDIAVRHQVWSGWPPSLEDDSTTLAAAGLTLPTHALSVKKNPTKEFKRIIVDLADSDSSVDEFEDASESFTGEDEMFVEDIGSKKMQPLIPDNVEDEMAGCIHFTEEFTNRYGAMHPDFFQGTLDDAIKEACHKPARERRLLAVYLHHDASVLTNVFCTQLLCTSQSCSCWQPTLLFGAGISHMNPTDKSSCHQ